MICGKRAKEMYPDARKALREVLAGVPRGEIKAGLLAPLLHEEPSERPADVRQWAETMAKLLEEEI
jgi:hypothetical protein